MKTCTIIGGIDGVGKSSLLGVLRAVRTDLGLVVDEKEKAASERIETALKDGISFSYETTLHGEFSKELCRRAKDAGYTVCLYYVALDPVEENLLRIKNRAKNGGENAVCQEVLNQYAHRFDNLTGVLQHIIICPQVERLHLILLIRSRREHYDRREIRQIGRAHV